MYYRKNRYLKKLQAKQKFQICNVVNWRIVHNILNNHFILDKLVHGVIMSGLSIRFRTR